MRLREKCACGAEFEVDRTTDSEHARERNSLDQHDVDLVKRWRRDHRSCRAARVMDVTHHGPPPA